MPKVVYQTTPEEIIMDPLRSNNSWLADDFTTTVYSPSNYRPIKCREAFEEILHDEFRIPLKQMLPEFMIFDKKRDFEIIDIAVFKDEKKSGQKDIVILVDCRSKNKKQAFQKAKRMLRIIPCRYFIWFNGKHRIGWRRKTEKSRIVEEVYKI